MDLDDLGIDKERTRSIVSSTLDGLVKGLDNDRIGEILYKQITPFVTGYSQAMIDVKIRFSQFESGFFVNRFKVFAPFVYTQGKKEKKINPSETVHDLLDHCQGLYLLLKDRIIQEVLSSLSGNPSKSKNDNWKMNFDCYPKETLNLTEDAAYWVKRLAQRNDAVGKKIREKLWSYGINHPDNLPEDVKKLGYKLSSITNELINNFHTSEQNSLKEDI